LGALSTQTTKKKEFQMKDLGQEFTNKKEKGKL